MIQWFLVLLLLLPWNAHAACGGIPGGYVSFGQSELDIDGGVTVNGVTAPRGDDGNALYPDATRNDASPTLPSLDPASFPANSSSTDVELDNSETGTLAAGSYDEVKLDNSARLTTTTVNGTYYIDELDLDTSARITLAPGTYYIEELKLGNSAQLIISPEGQVRLYIGEEFKADNSAKINQGGSVTNLLVMLYDAEVTLDNSVDFTGVLYSPDRDTDFEFKNSATIKGVVMTAGEIDVHNSVAFTLTEQDQIAVAALSTCTTAATADHFAISHDGAAVTCAAESVTITAHDADDATYTGYAGGITLSTATNHGNWSLASGNGAFSNGASDDGVATYTFVAADQGQAVFTLSDTTVENVDIDVTDGAVSDSVAAEDAALAFALSGFRFLADGVASAIPTQIAGKSSNVNPESRTLKLQAIRTDTNGACVGLFSGDQTVSLAYECRNPTTCANAAFKINGATIPGNPSGSVTSTTSMTLTFAEADATASLVLIPGDAGQIRLYAASASPAAVGSSNEFVARPFAFRVTGPSTTTQGAAGPVFVTAGSEFSATVEAVAWEAADDANNDGALDDNASPGDNAVTAQFGRESSPETIAFSRTLVLPAGGAEGTLAGGASPAFSDGRAAVADLSWDEVGIIDLNVAVADGDYLGAGAVTGKLANVGRFYPDQMVVSDVTVTPACTGVGVANFTYAGLAAGKAGQPFTYAATLTAQAVDGGTTGNYEGDFAKLTDEQLEVVLQTTDLTDVATLTDPPFTFGDGVANLNVADAVYAMTTEGAAQDLLLKIATEEEEIPDETPDTTDTASVFRQGRLVLVNGHGSELSSVAVGLQLQAHTGAGYAPFTGDGCTQTASYPDVTTNSCGTEATAPAGLCLTFPDTLDNNLEAGETSAAFGGTLADGTGLITLSAPGAGNSGNARVTLGVPAWLRDGDNPEGLATFGIFAGSDRIIDKREVFQ